VPTTRWFANGAETTWLDEALASAMTARTPRLEGDFQI
jgi:hypothetical protein